MSDSYEAPPAGDDDPSPRPDLRGHRLGVSALLGRATDELRARRVHGLIGGFAGGLAVGVVSLWAGVPIMLAVPAAAAVNLVLALWLPSRLISAADRRLLAASSHLMQDFGLTWRRAYGSAPIPRTEEQRLLWLGAQPATTSDPDELDIEGSILLSLGRYDDARDRIERLPTTTPFWRFERALSVARVEFESGGRGDLTAAREALAQLHGERRRAAVVGLGLEEAVQAVVRGEDWGPPIERAVRAAGPSIAAGITFGLLRLLSELPSLAVSELALAAVLFLVAVRLPA